ncbi:hypothetical protein A2Z23_02045 [Candidatus Curtissbacteria bacterium RBG_16_39_7]|uniref:Uncharacterized protein n=1 Tax=Candidatus Curtissbacteria bacterium RBG_16_39_7 TaxID=1797707 RepID=A0A1F5G2Q9_9BACT|nr:MAG: hypothetical protein A2Z23_02045 [Candidatus Curtissbacteria bacterium RBG_16_39_7]
MFQEYPTIYCRDELKQRKHSHLEVKPPTLVGGECYMSEKEKPYQIVKKESALINALLPKEHQSTLVTYSLEIGGIPTVFAWTDSSNDQFGAYWHNPNCHPNAYFYMAQKLVDNLKELSEVRPSYPEKSLILKYIPGDGQHMRMIISKFTPFPELGEKNLESAKLTTPYGVFEVTKTGENQFLTQVFMTHLTQDDQFSQFIVDNCKDKPSLEGVRQLLNKIQELRAQNIAA